MTVLKRVETLLLEKFKEEEDYHDYYIVEVKYTASANKLEVFLESDSTLPISSCARLNRYLQNHLDEENLIGETYILDVSSPGVGKPLKLIRQYRKNIGRRLEVWMNEGKPIIGQLTAVEDDKIMINQEIGAKKKKKEMVTHVLPFIDIKRAIVKISFKKG